MDLNPKLGESTAGAGGAVAGDERGQGDAKDKPILKKGKAKDPSSVDGTEAKGPLKELQGKMGACSLKTAGEESQAERRASWKEEVKKELEKREELKRKMEGVPMDQVMKWEDKLSMSKMSTEWREGFKEERTSYLFNEVFPLLLKTPKLYTGDAVLMCRRATKAWKDTIDHCLSTTLESFIPYRNKSGYLDHCSFPECVTWFRNGRQVTDFNVLTEALSSYLKNPFFSRKLAVGSVLPAPIIFNLEYWREMDKLLQRWGREVWMVMILLPTGMGMEMLYEMLVKYLTLMPNLRNLQIVDEDSNSMLEVETLRALGKDAFGPLKERMARKPLPELPNLRWILLSQFLPDPIIYAMLTKYRGSLESVQLKRPDMEPEEMQVGKDHRRPRMIHSLSSLMSHSHSTFDLNFPLLEKMLLQGYKAEGVEDVISLFKTLNGCGSKLRRLHLGMGFRVLMDQITFGKSPDPFLTKPIRLELPLLERITIDVTYTDLRNIDFLLGLKSLKELDLRFDFFAPKHVKLFSHRSSKGATIQFQGYEDRLHESNIWKLLPKLKLITMKVIRVFPELKQLDSKGVLMKVGTGFEKRVTYTRDGGKFEKVTYHNM